mgnify:CR=1 FL=1
MSTDVISIICLGSFFGGFVNGLTGFGTGLFALSWWLFVMSPSQAVFLVIAMSLVGGAQGMYKMHSSINLNILIKFILPAVFGIFASFIFFIPFVNDLINFLVATLLIIFTLNFIFFYSFPKFKKKYDFMDYVVGFVSGNLAILSGLSGVLITIWCSFYNWGKLEYRATVQAFNVIILGIAFILMLFQGALNKSFYLFFILSLPTSIIGTQIGIFLFQYLSDYFYKRLVLLLSIFSVGIFLFNQNF